MKGETAGRTDYRRVEGVGGWGDSTALVIHCFPYRDLSVLVNFVELAESSNRISLNRNLVARSCSFTVYTICTVS